MISDHRCIMHHVLGRVTQKIAFELLSRVASSLRPLSQLARAKGNVCVLSTRHFTTYKLCC